MKKNYLLLLPAIAMLFGGFAGVKHVQKEVVEPDNAFYDEEAVYDYDKPSIKLAPTPKKAVTSASSVSIHYHNDDGENDKREFWVWCSGVNGAGFAPTEVSNDEVDDGKGGTKIVHKDMVLTINFTGEHENFAGKKGIYFIVKKVGTWVGQSNNMYIDYEEFEPVDGKTEVWCIPGEGNAIEMYKTERETKMDRFQVATFEDWKTIDVIATAIPTTWKLYALTSHYMSLGAYTQKEKLNDYLIAEGSNPSCEDVEYNSIPSKLFRINLNYTAKVNVQYYLEGVFPEWAEYTKTKYVSFHKLYETDRFNTYYTYNGSDLGASYSKESTTFKVWAPTAARVRVLVYDSGTNEEIAEEYGVTSSDSARGFNMSFLPGGIWQATINGDLNGKYYNYYVVNSLGSNETIDPYAKACGVNGDRGMIVDWDSTDPNGWSNLPLKWDGDTNGLDIKTPNELSIYETHIRDLTMDESWNGKQMPGTYNAFVESGTTVTVGNETATTGFDHLVEMGYKAIHLLPVFDHDNNEELGNRTYNWGYNPKNYNCVEGSYSTDPYDGAVRIKEFKQMVLAFANSANKTRIIMDVVYNHVSSAPGSSFNKLMPNYYFRMTEDQSYYDGSGCGNEVKSEAPMMRKYIVDSLCWWASEYKIKGFRFDLMGLIDVGTIDAARRALYEIDPDILIYGEGWTGDGSGYDWNTGSAYVVHGHGDAHDNDAEHPISAEDKQLLGCVTSSVYRYLYPVANTCYVAAFNDAGRNAMRGDNNLDNGWGFIDQGSGDVANKSSTVANMMIGYHDGMGGNPNQCINYASCHDNYSLFDQVMNAIPGWEGNYNTYENPALACAAVSAVECAIMFSNGIALMQGGEELFRTKEVKSEEDLALVKDSDSHMIKDHKITHNAYNLSDDVNAFRWERKISINGVSTKGYVEEMAKAIKLRNSLKKYSYDELQAASPYSSSSNFNVWGQGDGKTTIAIKNGNYFCFISGCNDDVIPFGAYYDSTNKVAFTSNKTPDYNGFVPAGEGDGKGIKLGWYTTVCLYS